MADQRPTGTGVSSCRDDDGNLHALYRDEALAAGWTPPDVLAARIAEERAMATRKASALIGAQTTAKGHRRANAELFSMILWHEADEIEYRHEQAMRRARAVEASSG